MLFDWNFIQAIGVSVCASREIDRKQNHQEAIKMRPKSIMTLFAIIGLSFVLTAGGCRYRRVDRATAKEGDKAGASIAPSDAGADGKELAVSIVDKGAADVDFAEREEIRRAYKVTPGAKIEISNINGRIDIETADTDVAEVLIVRSAKKRDDLEYRRINIEHGEDFLSIRVEGDRKSIWSAMGNIPEGRQRVMLKLPRKVELETHGVNGHLTVGEIDGRVEVRRVNGPVNIARATGSASFQAVNGNIDATVAKLAGEGIEIRGVNGNTSLHFIGDVNADVEARGMNGRVEPELPNVQIRKGERYGAYNARIGDGGPQIEINGVNGNIYLGKSEKTPGDAPKAAIKTNAK
jgi:hypothetical protein